MPEAHSPCPSGSATLPARGHAPEGRTGGSDAGMLHELPSALQPEVHPGDMLHPVRSSSGLRSERPFPLQAFRIASSGLPRTSTINSGLNHAFFVVSVTVGLQVVGVSW
jgi:hypothetical protein